MYVILFLLHITILIILYILYRSQGSHCVATSLFLGIQVFIRSLRLLTITIQGLGDGSAVKSTACSSKGPEFNSHQPLHGSQPFVMRSDALLRKRLGQFSSSTQTMKPNMDKFNRTTMYGLPMHVSALPGHKFHFLFHFSRVTVLLNPPRTLQLAGSGHRQSFTTAQVSLVPLEENSLENQEETYLLS